VNPKLTIEQLIEFESRIASEFNNALIPHPVHLSSGNERYLIDIFQEVHEEDWVFCSWRSHLHALLKGVPQSDISHAIRHGRSISLCFPDYKFYSSGLVGGQIPIALGVAVAAKKQESEDRVWCFIGDMTAETGIANSCIKYAINHQLPVTFIVEDNGVSVCTETLSTWGLNSSSWSENKNAFVRMYKYTNSYPHAGAGRRVQF
jgi:pyruvate dehydrogenase E1 component alpha subunit